MRKTSELIWQDTQHQILFSLIDELKSTSANIDVFSRLRNFAENHFSLEEAYMRQLDYPNIEGHIAAHNKFREELNSMPQDTLELDSQTREAISIFLCEWLSRHVFGIDKELEHFILNQPQK